MERLGSEWSTPSRIEGAVSMLVAFMVAADGGGGGRRSPCSVSRGSGSIALVVLAGGIVFAFPAAVGGATAFLGLSGIIADRCRPCRSTPSGCSSRPRPRCGRPTTAFA